MNEYDHIVGIYGPFKAALFYFILPFYLSCTIPW